MDGHDAGPTGVELLSAEKIRMREQASVHVGGLESFKGRRASGAPIVAAIPAYNEEKFIGSLVLLLRDQVDTVLVVDDGSCDRTAQLARAAGATVVRHERNLGKAEAVNTAFRAARDLGAAAVVLLDGDGQHAPTDVSRVLGPVERGEADIVVGSRFLREGEPIPKVRRLGQMATTLATNLGSGVWVTDSQSGFRAFSRHAFETLVFRSDGFSMESEMQFRAKEHGLRVAEVPISAVYDELPRRNVFSHGAMVLNAVLRLVGRTRPLLFFGVPGLMALLAGLGLGFVVVAIFSSSQQLAIGYALIAVLLCMAGLLVMMMGVILHTLRVELLDLKRELRR